LARAPAGVKPAPRRRTPGNKGDSKEEVSDEDKYRGFTKSNALAQLVALAGKPKEKLALEYIDINIADIVKSPEWVKAPKEVLLKILRSDTLSIPEADLFDGCVAWAKTECKKGDRKADTDTLKKVMVDILPLIRFPTMSTTDVAAKVSQAVYSKVHKYSNFSPILLANLLAVM